MKRTLMLTTTLLLTPLALSAQQGDARSDARSEARIQAALETAAKTGVPEFLLTRKVVEGRAKGVAESHIASAVEARAHALIRARSLIEEGRETQGETWTRAESRVESGMGGAIDGGVTAAGDAVSRGQANGHGVADMMLLVATADALEAGVDADALMRVWGASADTESRTMATATTTALVRLGDPSADAARQVTGALRQGASALGELSASATAALEGRALLGGTVTGSATGHGSLRTGN